jgi:hypothetical protein
MVFSDRLKLLNWNVTGIVLRNSSVSAYTIEILRVHPGHKIIKQSVNKFCGGQKLK